MRYTQSISLLLALGLSVGCSKDSASGDGPRREPRRESEGAAPRAEANTPPADAERSDSGLVSKVLSAGRGEQRPAAHDRVRLNFRAVDGKGDVVDSSEQRGGPVTFDVTGVIAGWSEALQQMRVGERRRLWVPDQLTYPGRPGFPRAMTVFDLELLEILEGEPPPAAPPDVATVPADATKTESGLAYNLLTRGGSDQKPRAWDRVTVRYTGWTTDGTPIAHVAGGRPAVFEVGKAMPGWREALPLLAVGDTARLWLPEALAYQGRVGEPQGAVVFDLALVSIERRPEPPRPPAEVATVPANAKKTESGLAYRLLRRGKGKTKPSAGDRVEVHYSAWTSDGELFDSSALRGKPARIPLKRIIAGWAEGLQLMTVGDKALFWIPEALAYEGKAGSPKGMLVYEVELLAITR